MSEENGKSLELQAKLSELGDKIDGKLETFKEGLGEEYKKNLKGEVKELVGEYNKADQEKLDAEIKQLNERIDKAEMNYQKSYNGKNRSVKEQLEHDIVQNKDNKAQLEAFRAGRASLIKMDTKAALTTALNASGEAFPRTIVPGYFFDPTRAVRIRSFLNTGSTTDNTIRYIQEQSYTNNAAFRAEASAYAQSEFVIEDKSVAVKSLGSTIELTKEMLMDDSQMISYISTRLPEKVLNIEDSTILTGDGTSNTFVGLMADATAGGGTQFDETTGGAFYDFHAAAEASAYVNEYDVLVAGINQATLVEYRPSRIILNPTDYHKMISRKDADGQYVQVLQQTGTILGVPVALNTAMATGSFLIGDFRLGAQLWTREGLSVSFSYENSDNFEKDRVTVKGSERCTLTIYRPNAFVHGTFSGAFAALR